MAANTENVGTSPEVLQHYLTAGIEVTNLDWLGSRALLVGLSADGTVKAAGVGDIHVSRCLPVLFPFSALCTPLEDGTIPAVAIGKQMYSGSNTAEIVEHFDYKGRACVIKGPGTEVSISEHGFNNGTLAAGLVDLLREWHFAPLTAGKTLVEGRDYIAKSPASTTTEEKTPAAPATVAPRLNANGNPYPPMPAGQKCKRHMEEFSKSEADAPLATCDYNGCGHFVCDHCNRILNDQFDEDYY